MPRFLLVVSCLAILAPAPGALARPGGFHAIPGERLAWALSTLDLEAGAWEQIDAILDAAAAEGEPLRDEIRAAHEEMRALMESQPPDVDAILAEVDAIGALHVEARKHQLRTWFAVRAVLTDDQIRELAEMRREMHADFRRGRGHRGNDAPESGFDRLE